MKRKEIGLCPICGGAIWQLAYFFAGEAFCSIFCLQMAKRQARNGEIDEI